MTFIILSTAGVHAKLACLHLEAVLKLVDKFVKMPMSQREAKIPTCPSKFN